MILLSLSVTCVCVTYVAGREKDRDFTRALVRHRMIRRDVLEQRLEATRLEPQIRSLVENRIQADWSA